MRMLHLSSSLAIALLASGCYTTTTIAALPALRTHVPVSASSHYVAHDGAIVGPGEARPVRSFQLERTVRGVLNERAVRELRLDSALDGIATGAGGDALTRVELSATEFDPGSHYGAAGCRIFGWALVISGVAMLPAAVAMDQGEHAGYYASGALAGVGALFLLLAEALDAPPEWRLAVRGTVVRRTARK